MNKATTVLAPPGADTRGEARERAEPLEMLADEYLLEGQGERARTGILLIHGLTGTPNEMRVLARGLHLQGYTVYAVKLAGHCGTLDDLVGTSWLDWLASVRRGADLLSRRVDRVVVGGLSMGAVLALALAQERPEHIAGVLALSPAFRHDGWSMPRYTKLACLLPVMRALGIGRRSVFMEQPPYGIRTRRCAPAWFRRCTPATAPPRACRATLVVGGGNAQAGALGAAQHAGCARPAWSCTRATTTSPRCRTPTRSSGGPSTRPSRCNCWTTVIT